MGGQKNLNIEYHYFLGTTIITKINYKDLVIATDKPKPINCAAYGLLCLVTHVTHTA